MKKLPQHYKQVAKYVAIGWTSKAIAYALHMPVGTVQNIRCQVLKLYGCRNATQLAHLFLHRKFIPNIYATSSNTQR